MTRPIYLFAFVMLAFVLGATLSYRMQAAAPAPHIKLHRF